MTTISQPTQDLPQATPHAPVTLYQKAISAYQARRYEEAIQLCRTYLQQMPQDANGWTLLGVSLRKTGQAAKAIQAYQKATQLDPSSVNAHNNLGNALRDLDLYEAAIPHYKQAIALNPGFHEAYNNLGGALLSLGRNQEALRYLRAGIELKPDYPDGHWDLALTLLLQGDYTQGFAEYEWRFARGEPAPRPFAQPRWQGESFPGKTLLLHVEQGLGDVLQYLRFLPLVKARGGQVILEVQDSLLPLIRQHCPADQLIIKGSPPPPHDLQCPLLSLGHVLGITLRDLPGQTPYLSAPEEKVRQWQARLPRTGKPRVGLIWAGNPSFQRDRLRSPRLENMRPLLDQTNVEFIGLQMGDGRKDMDNIPMPANFHDVAPLIQDFSDTAGIMKNLDLVITSDSSPAHLAGALGIPCWVTLPFIADWRWLLWRHDSPWYPSLKLYRQPSHGDWISVIRQVATDLQSWTGPR